ncbi:hypothetical protein ACC676_01155 [Rhizobium ruizarguesonis]
MDMIFSTSVIESFLQLARSSGVVIACVLTFWGADKLLSDDGRSEIWKSMKENIVDRNASILIFDNYFGYSQNVLIFVRNIFLLSLSSMTIMLIGFSFAVPEFGYLFVHNADARYYFVRGILTEGLITIFVVNWFATNIEVSLRRSKLFSVVGFPFLLAADVLLRILIFSATVAFIYLLSSSWFGSFSGSKLAALRAVQPTLKDAVYFSNITGAYLYASAIAGLPLFVSAVIDLMQRWPTFGRLVGAFFFFLQFHKQPIRSSAFVVGTFFAMFSLVARISYGSGG